MTSRINNFVMLAALICMVVFGITVSKNANLPSAEYSYYSDSSIKVPSTPNSAPSAYYYVFRAYR